MNRQGTEYPLVSIIIPTYNNEARIARTLNCLIEQDYSNIEIIVVNDVSTDATADIARRVLMDGGRPFNVIDRSVNGGQSASRNTGLDAARGEYVIFFDHDDLAEKNYVSLLCGEAERTESDIVFCGYKDYYEKDGREVPHPNNFQRSPLAGEKFITAWIRGKFWCGVWCCIFKKKFLDDADLRFPEKYNISEDNEFLLKAVVSANRISFTNGMTYIYVFHANQQTANGLFIRNGKDMFENYMRSRMRTARYIVKKGTRNERKLMLNFYIPEVFVKRANRYARAKDTEKYEKLLRAFRHSKVQKMLLATAKFILHEPELFFKAVTLLYFPKLYYRLRS